MDLNKDKSLENIRSQELHEIITAIPNWMIRNGNTMFFLFLLLLLTLSYFIKYPETISAEATITTLDPPQKLYTNISGKIDTIFVNDNEIVKMNQAIAILENSANYRDYLLLNKTIKAFSINLDQMDFPIDEMPVLMLGEIEESYSNFENSYIKYILQKEYKDFEIKSKSNEFEVNEKQRRLSNLILKRRISFAELKLKNEDVKRHKILFEKGIISKQEFSQKQIDYLQSEKFAKNITLDISELKNEISLSEESLKLGDIDKIRSEKKLTKDVLQYFNKLKISITNWEKKYLLKSSKKGKISFLKYYKKNDFLKENELFVSIVPQEEFKPIAKLKTSVLKAGKLELGQRVNIKLKNYPYLEFGMLIGKVENVSLVPDDDKNYLIDVSINKDLITTYNKKLIFQHEMMGEANIITKDLSLIERLLNDIRHLVTKNKES